MILRIARFLAFFPLALIAQDVRPKTFLANGTSQVSFRFSDSSGAPKTWEEFSALRFPSDQDFALKIPNATGHYLGPDGGPVYQWSPGFYKWELLDGTSFTRRNSDQWSLEKGGYKVHSFPRKCPNCPPDQSYIFPDKTRIDTVYQEVGKRRESFYEDLENKTFFRFAEPGRYGSLAETFDRYEFRFSPRDSLFVHAFRETETLKDFFRKAEKDFGLVASSKILVAFFQDPKGFREFTNLSTAACAGGRGGIFGISFCDLRPDKELFVEDPDPVVRKYQYSTQFLHMIFHETGHHVQQVRCRILREGKTLPAISQPDWLVEGHAEFLAQFGVQRFRGIKYREYYENFILKKANLQVEKVNPYLSGFLVWDYVFRKYGDSKIRELWDRSCQGEETNSILQSITGNKLPQLQSELARFLETEAVPSKFLAWEMEGTLELKFSSPEAEDYSVSNLERSNQWADPSQIPDIRKSFTLKLEALKGKMEGIFRTSRKERVFLFRNGTYRLETPDYVAEVFPDGTTTYKSTATMITVWANGTRRWESGGKNLTYFPPKQ